MSLSRISARRPLIAALIVASLILAGGCGTPKPNRDTRPVTSGAPSSSLPDPSGPETTVASRPTTTITTDITAPSIPSTAKPPIGSSLSPPVTTQPEIAVTTTIKPSEPTTTIDRAASLRRCEPYVTTLVREAQLEVARVAGETISVLRSDANASGFSQIYDDAFSELRIAAARSGCAAADLARQALRRIDTVRSDGPVAVADKADIVSDLADRAGRSPLLIGPDAAKGALEVALIEPIAPLGAIETCRQLGAAWLSVYQSLLDAMDSVPFETYLNRSGVRDSDIRDNPENDGRGLHFASRSLDTIVSTLLQRGQDISCSDDDTAVRILEGGNALVAKSATSTVFKADQLAIAQLFLTGV